MDWDVCPLQTTVIVLSKSVADCEASEDSASLEGGPAYLIPGASQLTFWWCFLVMLLVEHCWAWQHPVVTILFSVLFGCPVPFVILWSRYLQIIFLLFLAIQRQLLVYHLIQKFCSLKCWYKKKLYYVSDGSFVDYLLLFPIPLLCYVVFTLSNVLPPSMFSLVLNSCSDNSDILFLPKSVLMLAHFFRPWFLPSVWLAFIIIFPLWLDVIYWVKGNCCKQLLSNGVKMW